MKKFIGVTILYLSLVSFTNATTPIAYTGATVNYAWVTGNKNTYLCTTPLSAAGLNSNIVCAQSEYPKTSGGAPYEQPTLKCPGTSKIKCFLYATYGLVGGRCDTGDFKEDPSGQWSYLPTSVASQAIGQNTFTFVVAANDMINGVSSPPGKIIKVAEEYRLKVIALCDGTNTATGTTPSPSPSTTGANYFKLMLISLVSILLIL